MHKVVIQGRSEGGFQGFPETPFGIGNTYRNVS